MDVHARAARDPHGEQFFEVPNNMILDGRNRYRACIEADIEPDLVFDGDRLRVIAAPGTRHFSFNPRVQESVPIRTINIGDPLAYVISANLHRRHLTQEQKRELVAKLVKAQPEKSNRQIAKIAKVDHHKVAKIRREEEDVGNLPHVETRTDTKGRKQPAKRAKICVHGQKKEIQDDFKKDEDIGVEDPIVVKNNFLDSISRDIGVFSAYKKVFKASTFNQGLKDEIRAAIGRLISKLQSLERALKP